MDYVEFPGEIQNADGTTIFGGTLLIDGPALMGYVLSQLHLTTFDNSDAGASVAGSSTVTVRTISGKGSAMVVLDGTGAVDVTIKYSVDGGADTAIATSDQAVVVALAFTTSLVLKATNANAAAKNRCGISSTCRSSSLNVLVSMRDLLNELVELARGGDKAEPAASPLTNIPPVLTRPDAPRAERPARGRDEGLMP